MSEGFWHGKRVFLTGHTGFKGGWAALWLKLWGAEICGYALAPSTDPSLFQIAGIDHDIESIIADIRDFERLRAEIARFKPDIILHMAAQPLVRASYENPVETYSINVMGTVNILEALRATSTARVLVNITTDKCYENREWIWGYREHDPMGGHDPYSSSKGCAELVTSSYRNSFFNRPDSPAVASCRAGNVVGGGDWSKDRLVPDIIRAFLRNEPVAIRNPTAVRPWQHVLEPVSGYLLLAERLWNEGPRFTGAWNFGPEADSTRTVGEVTTIIANCWGASRSWQDCSDPTAPHEAHLLQLDITKARTKLGWRPRWSLQETLAATVAWYQAADHHGNMREFSESQITSYQAVA